MAKNNFHKFLILGGGMAGLGTSIALREAGKDSLILEKDEEMGGLCRNQNISGCDFDYGPKILLLNDSNNSQEILSFLDGNYEKYPVVESVYLSKYGQVGFPLQRNLIDLPKAERKKIIDDLLLAHKHPLKVLSFKDWLINSYGKYFCELILFPYEEKKWQSNLEKMDYHWALERPIKVDKEEVLEGTKSKLPPNRWYYYPKHGNITTLSSNIAKKAGKVILNSPIQSVNLKEKFVVSNNKRYYYQYLISTIPIDYFTDITLNLPKKIKQRSKKILKRLGIVVVNIVFKGDNNLKGSAIYFPEKEFIFRRVSLLQNLCPALARNGFTPISVEISVDPNKKIDKPKLLKETLEGFSKIDQFAKLGKPINYAFLDIDFAYPLQLNGLSAHIDNLHQYYLTYDVYHCGRGGKFDYCNLDQAYKQGKEVTRKILSKI